MSTPASSITRSASPPPPTPSRPGASAAIKLEFVPRNPRLRAGHEDHVAASFTVLRFLQGRGFDTVFFNECGGQGYHSLLAKKAGLFPDAPRMIVVTHGASAWVLELNAQLYWSLHPISVDHLERRSVELADDLVSPSRYLAGLDARERLAPARLDARHPERAAGRARARARRRRAGRRDRVLRPAGGAQGRRSVSLRLFAALRDARHEPRQGDVPWQVLAHRGRAFRRLRAGAYAALAGARRR